MGNRQRPKPQRARRPVLALALVAGLVAALAVPALANHAEQPRSGFEEVGFIAFDNEGFNSDVWSWVPADERRLFAVNGTWGTLTAFGADPAGDPCPSETDNPLAPTKSGVKVVDLTDPADPTEVARVGTEPGAQNNDVKVLRVDTSGASAYDGGDILAMSLEPCGAEGILAQIPGSPFADPVAERLTGFQLVDVSEPTGPVPLGKYTNGGIGVHNLYMFNRPDLGKSYVAAVWSELRQLDDPFIRSQVQIVDITDPEGDLLGDLGDPVGTWELADAETQAGLAYDDLCTERGAHFAACVLHDVWVSDDGTELYANWWDAGQIVLDITDPAAPQFVGQYDYDAATTEGNNHSSVPLTVDGRNLLVIGDEDFVGGGTGASPLLVTVNSPASLAGSNPAVQWGGTAEVDETGVTGDFYYAGTGCTAADYAVAASTYGTTAAGKIVVVDSFSPAAPFAACPTYTFTQKVNQAVAAGAIGFVQLPDIGDEPNGNATAGASPIPGFEVFRTPDTEAFVAATAAGDAVNGTLHRGLIPGEDIDPWGFMRVLDITDPDPANWAEVATFEAPHVRDPLPDAADVFSAHNPIVGPDGRVYFSWYTDGVRVLEVTGGGATVTEAGWFAPHPDDHPDDNESDPNLAQESQIGFWGSFPICDPRSDDLLVVNSDLNRGLYVLRSLLDNGDACDGGDLPGLEAFVTGGGQVASDTGERVSFGFNARDDGSAVKGNVNVKDHGSGQHVKSVTITSVVESGGQILVSGTCSVDGGAAEACVVTAEDNGEPGTGDVFRIEVGSNGASYSAGGLLLRGNVQVH